MENAKKELKKPVKERFAFRLTHIDNLPHIAEEGILCSRHPNCSASYIPIGNNDVIAKRSDSIKEGGEIRMTPAEYVPFYFTYRTPMLLNILSGQSGATKRSPRELCWLVAKIGDLMSLEEEWLCSDGHLLKRFSRVYNQEAALESEIDWELIYSGDFTRDEHDRDRMRRYQAEFLVRNRVPLAALSYVLVKDATARAQISKFVEKRLENSNISVRESKRAFL